MRNENKNINLDFSSDHGDFLTSFFFLFFLLLLLLHQDINDFWTYFYYFMMNKTIYYPPVLRAKELCEKQEKRENCRKELRLFPFKFLSFDVVFKSCH